MPSFPTPDWSVTRPTMADLVGYFAIPVEPRLGWQQHDHDTLLITADYNHYTAHVWNGRSIAGVKRELTELLKEPTSHA